MAAAGFVGLLSLLTWAGGSSGPPSPTVRAESDLLHILPAGDRAVCGGAESAHIHSVALFVACYCVILSMYGGGFATIPAYLEDVFGVQFVGAIHGRC